MRAYLVLDSVRLPGVRRSRVLALRRQCFQYRDQEADSGHLRVVARFTLRSPAQSRQRRASHTLVDDQILVDYYVA